MKNKAALLALLGISAMVFTGCKRYEPANSFSVSAELEETKSPIVLETTAETEAETETESDILLRIEKDGKIPSYLTGEMTDTAIANRRPVAIMISNDKEAQPHYGINHAGVIYEAPVEGGINRYMAILEDYDGVDRIGSVRSCRTYYTYFAREFEAIYAHFGQSVFALPYLEHMEHLNGIEGKGSVAFYRTKDKKSPHNAYTSGDGLKKGIAAMGYSEDYPSGYEGHYQFANPDKPELLEDGFGASYVKPGYLINNPWFEYNAEDGLYYRFQFGGPHNGNEGQLAVKNIIFQYCGWGYYKPSEYLDIDVHTPGVGYYFTNGRGTTVTWKKDGAYGATKYYDKDGQEIRLNPGKTWVCIITSDRMDKAEYHGEQTE